MYFDNSRVTIGGIFICSAVCFGFKFLTSRSPRSDFCLGSFSYFSRSVFSRGPNSFPMNGFLSGLNFQVKHHIRIYVK